MRKTILIVDDSTLVLAWLRSQLEAGGYDVVATSQPFEAGVLVARTQPAAIIVDIVMPQIECGDVIADIRMYDPQGAIPVILYSGQPLRRLHETAIRYGASGYAPKKRDVSELLAVLERCMNGIEPRLRELTPLLVSPGSVATSCLFVDDDASMLRAYQRFFANKIEADFVTSAVDALGRLHAVHPPRFVVSDLIMPQMSGFDLYARAVSLDEGWRNRFVFVTGSDAWRKQPDSPAARVPVLPKPISVERLHAYIQGRG